MSKRKPPFSARRCATTSTATIPFIVDLGDLHCGSTVGLLPPGFVTLEGQEIKQNIVQRWLWDCWTDATEKWLPELIGDEPFALVLKGDLTEGKHHGGHQLISDDLIDHQEAAKACLDSICKRAAKVLVIEGTECHTGTMEHKVASHFKAIPDPNTGKPAWEKLFIDNNGVRSVFQHHISPTVREYLRGSMLSIFLRNEQIAAADSGEPIPQVLSCAHRHKFDLYRAERAACVVTPPFQALTRHGLKVVPAARVRPGIVVHDYRGKAPGEIPEFHARTYTTPPVQGAQL